MSVRQHNFLIGTSILLSTYSLLIFQCIATYFLGTEPQHSTFVRLDLQHLAWFSVVNSLFKISDALLILEVLIYEFFLFLCHVKIFLEFEGVILLIQSEFSVDSPFWIVDTIMEALC